MTSFNSLSPSLSGSLAAPRQRSERIVQFGKCKSTLNMEAFGLSVSCSNKNVRQVCEPGFFSASSLLSENLPNTLNKSYTLVGSNCDHSKNHNAQRAPLPPPKRDERNMHVRFALVCGMKGGSSEPQVSFSSAFFCPWEEFGKSWRCDCQRHKCARVLRVLILFIYLPL